MRLTSKTIRELGAKYGTSAIQGIHDYCRSDAIDGFIRLNNEEYMYISKSGNYIDVEIREAL